MSQVLVEQDGAILTVTLNRPHRRNALTLTSFRLLADVWAQADENPDIRAIVVTGAGGSFCSGMDLRALGGDSDETSPTPSPPTCCSPVATCPPPRPTSSVWSASSSPPARR
ncbi:hypothetical protein FAGKG844_270007 [Frankia sp. AgKG'84/4]|nr:enoyl-CoA hydratase-related protein [Frankia sp. AgKG'84/4]MCL9794010.1 enoyl-CoA hydratase-related protein [Frankia sp. AgKG'84/4]